jgi:hypothetical protein
MGYAPQTLLGAKNFDPSVEQMNSGLAQDVEANLVPRPSQGLLRRHAAH